jgi:hypothetical protein
MQLCKAYDLQKGPTHVHLTDYVIKYNAHVSVRATKKKHEIMVTTYTPRMRDVVCSCLWNW